MTSSPIDLKWMDRALDLAELGRYTVSPNPMVGAVLVRGGRVIGEAFHRRAGEAHAEAAALLRAGSRARGADLYLTLEPCAHFGRTPPCADAIVAAGVSRVIVGSRDPHPLVRGRGLGRLSRAGVEVLSADAARRRRAQEQNEKFRIWADEGRPFVLAKWAASLDGHLATSRGESRWITGAAARRSALLLREEYDAVLVGAGTVLADDPRLTRRLGRNQVTAPWRVVLDGRLRAPERARLFREAGNCVVLTALPESHPRARRLARHGVEVWSLPSRREGRVDLRRALAAMAQREITSLLVEGGAETLGSFFDAGLVDRVAVFTAPRILGGTALAAVGGRGFALASGPRLRRVEMERIGADWLVTGRVIRRPD